MIFCRQIPINFFYFSPALRPYFTYSINCQLLESSFWRKAVDYDSLILALLIIVTQVTTNSILNFFVTLKSVNVCFLIQFNPLNCSILCLLVTFNSVNVYLLIRYDSLNCSIIDLPVPSISFNAQTVNQGLDNALNCSIQCLLVTFKSINASQLIKHWMIHRIVAVYVNGSSFLIIR